MDKNSIRMYLKPQLSNRHGVGPRAEENPDRAVAAFGEPNLPTVQVVERAALHQVLVVLLHQAGDLLLRRRTAVTIPATGSNSHPQASLGYSMRTKRLGLLAYTPIVVQRFLPSISSARSSTWTCRARTRLLDSRTRGGVSGRGRPQVEDGRHNGMV